MKIENKFPHVNVGTIGQVDHGKAALTAAIVAVQAPKPAAREIAVIELGSGREAKFMRTQEGIILQVSKYTSPGEFDELLVIAKRLISAGVLKFEDTLNVTHPVESTRLAHLKASVAEFAALLKEPSPIYPTNTSVFPKKKRPPQKIIQTVFPKNRSSTRAWH